MTNGIHTNRFSTEFCYEAIDRDFDIYVLTREKDMYKLDLSDVPSDKYKFLAVQYTRGRNVFVLFRRNAVSEYDYRREIEEKYADVSVKKLDISDSEERRMYYFDDRLLAQLLINSIKNPKNEKYTFHNITGRLYYSDPAWIRHDRKTKKIKSFYVLEAAFTKEMCLKLSVKSFTKKFGEPKGEREYVFDKKTGVLRAKLKSDDKCETFIVGNPTGSHNTVDYLNFRSFDDFGRCKLGVMKRILDNISEKLGEYMTLTAEHMSGVRCYEVSKEQKKATDCAYLAGLIETPVHIVDELKTPESEAIAERIKYELENFSGLPALVGNMSSDGSNIRIIHDYVHYLENKAPDIHSDIPVGAIVQHVTLENMEECGFISDNHPNKESYVVCKLIQELVIKRDIINKKITVFDWKKSGLGRAVTFAVRNKTAYGIYEYKTLTISPEGDMRFEKFRDSNDELSNERQKIIRAYEKFVADTIRTDDSVEGLMFYSYENIHAIIRTPMSTMPDIYALWNGLKMTVPDDLLDKEMLLDALDEFALLYPESADYSDRLRDAVNKCSTDIKKKEFNKLMDFRGCDRKSPPKLNEFLWINYGLRVNPRIKSKDTGDEYNINNILDIKYYYHTDEKKRQNEFRYFVGTKSKQLQTSVHNACAVRKVISEVGTPEFEDMLPLLAVDFVRNNQYTVLPFPFKFLREYMG